MATVRIANRTINHETKDIYRQLRRNLKFYGEDKKVLLFTSCIECEGRGDVVLQLGKILAEEGRSVLLIDKEMQLELILDRWEHLFRHLTEEGDNP